MENRGAHVEVKACRLGHLVSAAGENEMIREKMNGATEKAAVQAVRTSPTVKNGRAPLIRRNGRVQASPSVRRHSRLEMAMVRHGAIDLV
jgi:hypothetical protein